MDLKELEGWEGDLAGHWYYASKAAALTRILGELEIDSIADIGAGSGFFSKHLLAGTSARVAYCVDINYRNDTDHDFAGKRVVYRRRADGIRADLYLLMDVLEHVEDDAGFLRAMVDQAPAGARFAISVPAFRFLWSGHDVFLGHHRRYTLKEISTVAERAGLSVEKRCYFFGAIFPAVAAVRVLRTAVSGAANRPASDMRRVPQFVNTLLRTVCKLEETAFTANRAFGLTAFLLATRPQAH